jgi:hypothetical protein
MFFLTSFESYSDESELTYLVLCFFLLFLLLRLTSDGPVSSSGTKYKSKSKKIKRKNKSGMVAKASDYVVNPQIWPHTARIYLSFCLGSRNDRLNEFVMLIYIYKFYIFDYVYILSIFFLPRFTPLKIFCSFTKIM